MKEQANIIIEQASTLKSALYQAVSSGDLEQKKLFVKLGAAKK